MSAAMDNATLIRQQALSVDLITDMVAVFQEDLGLPVTGLADPATQTAIGRVCDQHRAARAREADRVAAAEVASLAERQRAAEADEALRTAAAAAAHRNTEIHRIKGETGLDDAGAGKVLDGMPIAEAIAEQQAEAAATKAAAEAAEEKARADRLAELQAEADAKAAADAAAPPAGETTPPSTKLPS